MRNNGRTLLFIPGMITSATAISNLRGLIDNGINIDDISGYSLGSIISTLYVAGLTPEQIQSCFEEYASRYSKDTIKSGLSRKKNKKDFDIVEESVNACIKKYTGRTDMTLADMKKLGKNLLIHVSRQDENGNLSPFIISADNFPNLSVAKACQASATLPAFKPYELEYEGTKYVFRDGCLTAPDLPVEEYQESFISTFEYTPKHFRSKRIANLMSKFTSVLAPKVSYRWLLIVGGKHSINKLCKVGTKYCQEELNGILSKRTMHEKGREFTREEGFIQETPVISQEQIENLASIGKEDLAMEVISEGERNA